MKCQAEGCKFKIKIFTGECSTCDKKYCRRHRLPFEHNCNVDEIQKQHKKRIEDMNPIVPHDKLPERI